ncbi:MAG: class II fructose-1,6-bisphosphate aldolase [Firmicutes bacterium]|nr:class II fructose-1,6-bisphosphate aldolase [Bacillota bacterium]
MALVSSKEMLIKAYQGGYAVGAFNVNNMELIQGIVTACKEEKAPLILQVSNGAKKYAGPVYLRKLVEAAIEESGLDICLHLDHGSSYEDCVSAIKDGFTSVMIDASHHSFNENILITSEVVKYAKDHGVTVEAELGRLAGIEDDINVSLADSSFTDPSQVEEFVAKTGVDSLAIAIGTSHGAFKFKGEPKLRFDILEDIQRRLPNFPIVLHGASSVLPKYVDIITEHGGAISGAKGVPEEMLRQAARMAVCKINIDSDLRLAFTAAIRQSIYQNPSHFDPRQYLIKGREIITEVVRHKILHVLGCGGKI